MRKVSREAAEAFMRGELYRRGNTEVDSLYNERYDMTTDYYLVLHGNIIARRIAGESSFEITFAGWQTNTTKERLNALPGVSIHFEGGVRRGHTGQAYLNGEKWDGSWKEIKATNVQHSQAQEAEA